MNALPNGFQELEPFVAAWARPTFSERYGQRLANSYAELKAFYDRILPRMDDIMRYVDNYQIGSMPPDALRLARLAQAFMVISPAAELFEQGAVPYGHDWTRVDVDYLIPELRGEAE